MIFIFGQKGATSLGFQIGRAELSLVYPRYWGKFKAKFYNGGRTLVIDFPNVFHFHIWPKGR